MCLFLFMGMGTTLVMFALMYTNFRWIPLLYLAWLAYDWRTPLTGGRSFKYKCVTTYTAIVKTRPGSVAAYGR